MKYFCILTGNACQLDWNNKSAIPNELSDAILPKYQYKHKINISVHMVNSIVVMLDWMWWDFCVNCIKRTTKKNWFESNSPFHFIHETNQKNLPNPNGKR